MSAKQKLCVRRLRAVNHPLLGAPADSLSCPKIRQVSTGPGREQWCLRMTCAGLSPCVRTIPGPRSSTAAATAADTHQGRQHRQGFHVGGPGASPTRSRMAGGRGGSGRAHLPHGRPGHLRRQGRCAALPVSFNGTQFGEVLTASYPGAHDRKPPVKLSHNQSSFSQLRAERH